MTIVAKGVALRWALIGALAAAAWAGPAARADEPSLSVHDRLVYRAAFKAASVDHWVEAKRLAGEGEDKLLAKVIDWMFLENQATAATFDATSAFIAQNPTWPMIDRMRARAEASMPDTMTPAQVRAWFETYPPLTATGDIRYGDALVAGGDMARGMALLRKAWIDGNLGEVQAEQFLKKDGRYLRPEDNLARLDRLLWDGQTAAAHAMERRVDSAHAALAEARIRLLNMAGGVDYALRRVPERLKDDPGLLYDRLRWNVRKNHDDEARAILAHAPADLGRPELWWQERQTEVHRALLSGFVTDALRLAEENGQAPGTPSYADAEWLAGWIALRQLHDPALALAHFRAMAQSVRYPVSLARASYWEARALDALGKSDDAVKDYTAAAQYGVTYYGQLAALRLGRDLRPTLPPPPVPAVYVREAFDGRQMVRVVIELGQLESDAVDSVQGDFIKRLAALSSSPDEAVLVGDLALQETRPDLAVRLARLNWHNEGPLAAFGYPLRSLPRSITPEAALVLAVIRQESAFDERAISRAGALGLMQLMPATARKIAAGLGLHFGAHLLTADPNYNIKVGSAYLASLLNAFGGNYVLALAAYNAGPSHVHQWIREEGDPRTAQVDAIDWIEMIPFDETRNYVQRVLEALQVYRARVPGAEAGNLATDMGNLKDAVAVSAPASAPDPP
ncbi:MAG TPA: lytic transglycosylase domain-containing protein [Alphaproteobacteria bacterium]|nr:lytic transglycosylase domain-containing protein [Alphaproteobacteria bacterium]